LSLTLIDTRVYEPRIRARLGTTEVVFPWQMERGTHDKLDLRLIDSCINQMERGTHDQLEREEALREEWNELEHSTDAALEFPTRA